MDFIILNSDGSLQKQSLTRYIQQGSHGVDEIFIGWVNATSSQTLQAVFTLPNQLTNTELGVFEEDYEYEPGETINGWVITLTENQTRYNGALMVSARVILNGFVQVAYPFALIINETGVRPETDSGITLAQLDSYLLNIQNLVTGAVRQNTDATLSSTSENPVQNKVISAALEAIKRGSYTKVDTTEYPTLEDFLDSEGEEGFLYLYPIDTSDEDEGYYQYIWENEQWISLGTTKIDIANMMTTDTAQSVSGQKTFAGGVIISTSFSSQGHLPATTETYDLGSNEKKWDKVFLRTIHTAGGNLSFSVGSNIEIYCNNGAYLFPNQDGYLYLGKSNKRFSNVYTSGITNDFSALSIRGKSGVNFQCDNGSAVRPSTNEQINLGESTARWNYVYTKYISDGTNNIAVSDIAKQGLVASQFDETVTYNTGDLVIYQRTLYKMTSSIYAPGSFLPSLFTETNIATELKNVSGKLYLHRISVGTNSRIDIVSSSNVPFTNQTLAEYLYNHNYRTAETAKPYTFSYILLGIQNATQMRITYGLFASGANASQISSIRFELNIVAGTGFSSVTHSQFAFTYTISDAVEEIK